ncbi:hypothetical protein A3I27_01585 [Candidatus Giovannonibacteria bacterium RIFCSPLOWO2_02_FULL_43_11b]|uniref:dTDP-4-dehydrorhamnose reductase n=1 Tax=Candidatus Giovannonibacteria bacterium RIFCSPHIGHO2_12_FULL_43_15 TaxID=1798341 RepID=A0A1F5WP57_9BACT|nr:MAG: hypothetical protein A2739_01060 [Candidatus Giovannonibacteria bacterium RIFCSPHIGHO2_01_FULL_43_100]OGF66449.1 MAG: hypothetical protein A3B97_03860 [Candidatus Giovannonibacteria bacterium RIFCSPHIGHO2_02_FULL_43_32]OGF77394.1 MAG: hypothetical protein A3F23_03645 [Candidatus Giovannonibacteria bacterium RIFCSPHIGHO2_12_FULL_43_15]OGF78420.1 MAG: hypothetical protein A3A15_03435 [Candidatus Giovannonibacteria bacterium RIFCSPLOWO2_01_FULL_43_60]OGF89779.1 MAG: hypothetical protein A3
MIFGNGWLGNKFKDSFHVALSPADITDKKAIVDELIKYRPECVINAAGKTGKPNIDWCEDHKMETISSNVIGPLILAEICLKKNIYFGHISSGCIYDGAAPKESGFSEKDKPNPISFYSWTKVEAEKLLKPFPFLIMRIRMPFDSRPHQRNLITKLAGYKNIIDAYNSLTSVEDFLNAAKILIEKRATGVFNIVNDGIIGHKEIMDLYQKIVDPSISYTLIKPEELLEKGLVKAGRSNCKLDNSKLVAEGIKMRNAKEAIKSELMEYKKFV